MSNIDRPPTSLGDIEYALCDAYSLNNAVAREYMKAHEETVARGIVKNYPPGTVARTIMLAIGDRFYRIRIDGREYHGTADQCVRQMQEKSVLHLHETIDQFLGVLLDGLDLNGVKVTLDDDATLEEKCKLILEASIAAGLTDLIERGVK